MWLPSKHEVEAVSPISIPYSFRPLKAKHPMLLSLLPSNHQPQESLVQDKGVMAGYCKNRTLQATGTITTLESNRAERGSKTKLV